MFRLPWLCVVALQVLWVAKGQHIIESATETDPRRGHSATSQSEEDPSYSYGVDVSWPTHHDYLYRFNFDGKSRASVYREFLQGCFHAYGSETCTQNEDDRIARNVAQPPMQTNFTTMGYAKVATPTKTLHLLQKYWKEYSPEQQATRSPRVRETWAKGDTHVNHWASPTQLLLLDHPDGPAMPVQDRHVIISQTKELLERWSQTTLIPTSLYGIRIYTNGTILSPHVDRLPLVLSAIINVAQDVQEPWPLEVIGHDGKARNITMEAGDMILYEGHSVIHGRPFALNGTYFANVFLHFEPLQYTKQMEAKIMQQSKTKRKTVKQRFQEALSGQWTRKDTAKEEASSQRNSNLPHYIDPDSEEAVRWRQEFYYYRDKTQNDKRRNRVKGVTTAHIVAARGNLGQLKEIETSDPESLFKSDSNGWKPIHEAARGGRTEVVEYLIKKGADVNERTNEGQGANALWWAKHQLPDDHPTIRVLLQYGAVAIGPND